MRKRLNKLVSVKSGFIIGKSVETMNLEKVFRQFIEHAQSAGLPIEGIAVGNEDRVLMEHHFTPDRIRRFSGLRVSNANARFFIISFLAYSLN